MTINIAFTSYPRRIANCTKVINSILRNTVVPDRIFLTLSHVEFPNKEDDLPKKLNELINSSKVILTWVEDNYKSMKKLFPVLPYLEDEDVIIDIDDDMILPKDFIESRVRDFKDYGCKYPITSNTQKSINLDNLIVQCYSLFQKKMLNGYEKFVDETVLNTFNDDRTYLYLCHLNGYQLKPCTKYCVNKNANMKKLRVSPRSDYQYLVGSAYDSVLAPKISSISGGRTIGECFGLFNEGKCQTSSDTVVEQIAEESIKMEEPIKIEEPTPVEPIKIEPIKIEPKVVDTPKVVEPIRIVPTKVEPTKVEPTKVEPTKVEPIKIAPPKKEVKVEQKKPLPKPAPKKVEQVKKAVAPSIDPSISSLFQYGKNIKHDVVYVLGSGSKFKNLEIKISITSLLKYCSSWLGTIYVVGDNPYIMNDRVKHIYAPDITTGNKDANIIYKLKVACQNISSLSDNFLFCSDDILVTRESSWEDFAPRYVFEYHQNEQFRNELYDRSRGNRWDRLLLQTMDRFIGYREHIYFYEPHIFAPINKNLFLEMCKQINFLKDKDVIVMSLWFNWLNLKNPQKRFDHQSVFQSKIPNLKNVARHLTYNDKSFSVKEFRDWLIKLVIMDEFNN